MIEKIVCLNKKRKNITKEPIEITILSESLILLNITSILIHDCHLYSIKDSAKTIYPNKQNKIKKMAAEKNSYAIIIFVVIVNINFNL